MYCLLGRCIRSQARSLELYESVAKAHTQNVRRICGLTYRSNFDRLKTFCSSAKVLSGSFSLIPISDANYMKGLTLDFRRREV
jgi:hypothetical protein